MTDMGSGAGMGYYSYKITQNPTMFMCFRSGFSLTPERPWNLDVCSVLRITQLSSRAESPGREQAPPGRPSPRQPGHSCQHCRSPSSETTGTRSRATQSNTPGLGGDHTQVWDGHGAATWNAASPANCCQESNVSRSPGFSRKKSGIQIWI